MIKLDFLSPKIDAIKGFICDVKTSDGTAFETHFRVIYNWIFIYIVLRIGIEYSNGS